MSDERKNDAGTDGSHVSEKIRHVGVPSLLRSVKRRVPKPLKKAARNAARGYGERTATRRTLPNFLVMGTKRGGSTSLWDWLVRHPHVAPMFPASQQIKSPHYFDINYYRGPDWYRSHFPTERSLDRIEHRTGVRPLCGEASPYYMFHPAAPARIAELIPNAKLLVSLRNPVDRAYSNYSERRGSGAETLSTFEAAIEAEPERLTGEAEKLLADDRYYSLDHDSHSYLARGRYVEQLSTIFDHFDRSNVLVLLFDQLTKDSPGTYRQVQEFLGLPVVEVPKLPHHNRLPVPPMAAETRKKLVDYYRPHNAALAELLGMELNWDK